MSRIQFSIRSSRGDCDLCCYKWIPGSDVKAVLFISHGMEEHILWYDGFAEYLNSKGIAVYGHDQLGHGRTSPDDFGFIAEKNGDDCLMDDMLLMEKTVEKDYPNVLRIIFGHSMGSFVIRRYLTKYGDTVDGAIAMGTGQNPLGLVRIGLLISKLVCRIKGTHSMSKMLDHLIMGKNSDPFPGEHPFRWLSYNEEYYEAYFNDPWCGFNFTAAGYRDLLTMLKRLGCKEDFNKVPKDLRIIMISGADDVIGDFGKGVDRCLKALSEYDIHLERVTYEGMRHCPLMEKDSERVSEDISKWILSLRTQ